MTRTERLLRLARQRGDRAAELILHDHRPYDDWYYADGCMVPPVHSGHPVFRRWSEAELREAWGR